MEALKKNKDLLNQYLTNYLKIANAAKDGIRNQLVIDLEQNTYLLLCFGWTPERFIHFVVFHFEIKNDGKIWLYENRTDESVVEKLMELGIRKTDIILELIEPHSTKARYSSLNCVKN